ncbi:MAG TPA: STAS domain-containing protein [Bryobacterales bacterium]|nr:STAS domain-containing protein [Bryobacterales bacterium]
MTSGDIVAQRSPAGVAGPPRIFAFSGRLTYGPENEQRYEEFRAAMEEGARDFIFDLQHVPDMDSAGIGFLVECLTTSRRMGARLTLAAPSNRVLYSLLITRLDSLFPVYETVEAALAGASRR